MQISKGFPNKKYPIAGETEGAELDSHNRSLIGNAIALAILRL